MTATQQLPAHGSEGLDVAATAVGGERKFQGQNLTRADAYTSKQVAAVRRPFDLAARAEQKQTGMTRPRAPRGSFQRFVVT